MKKGKAGKAVKITLITIAAVIVLLFGGGYFYYSSILNSPQPSVDGQFQAKGLQDKVEVIRDSWGVPHIYAKNMHDLFFAQGYAQAQDRWWQMEFFRKTCGGRIEELTGKKASLVNTDIYLRSLGLYKVCQKEYDIYTPDQRMPLDAFAEGVNAYISNRSPQQLSVNYSILGLTGVKFKIDPWSPLDTLAFAKLMGLDLGLNRDTEITRGKLESLLGAEMADKWLLPAWPAGSRSPILLDEDIQTLEKSAVPAPQSSAGQAGNTVAAVTGQSLDDPATDLSQVLAGPEGIGSNSWVCTGSMTQSGKSLLANDPHLGIQMPSVWYEIALHCPDDGSGRPLDVAGFTFAANPSVVVGHNNDIAWGTTNVYPDVNDQYMIRVNPDNPLQYEWDGKWRDMTVRQEQISFGDGKPAITIKVRETHLGPIMNDNKWDAKSGEMQGLNNKDPLALHWTALEPSKISLAILGLNKAKNWDEFRDALKSWDVPSQSIIFADTKGNIGYQMPGKIPIRPKNYAGQVPAPGWTSDYEWKGYIPFDLLPRAYNPARQYIVAANQEVAPSAYYDFLQKQLGTGVNANFGSKYNRWCYGYRSERITELLKQMAPNSVTTYQSIQGDNKYIFAGEILPSLANLKFSDPELADARDWLVKWDGVCNMDSPHAALFDEFWDKLMNNIYQNKLGDAARATGSDKEMRAVVLLLQNPSDPWWDDPSTKGTVETRDEVLTRSFAEGYAATVTALGKDRSQWKWGKLHTATFVSNPLGASGIGPIESLVNWGPVSIEGNTETVNATYWNTGTGKFTTTAIATMRIIVDMSDLTKCTSMNSTGESGHPGNHWYGNMVDSWRNAKYRPMLWTRQQVDSDAAHKLYLNP